MKRYTALFTAILLVLVLAGGGAVYLFNIARAAIDPAIEVPFNQPGLKMFNCAPPSGNFDEIYITKRSLDYNADVVAYYDNNKYHIVVCSYTSGGLADYRLYLSSSGQQYNYTGFYLNQSYPMGGYTYYYYDYPMDNSLYITQTLIPLYNNFTDAIEACIDGLNYTTPPSTYTYNFTIPAGYAAFIEYADDIEISLSAQMYDLSTPWYTGDQPWFWPGDLAAIGTYASIPDVGSTFSTTGFNNINWQRGSDRNLYNQTKSAVYEDTIFYVSNSYAVIYNPAYYIIDLNDGETKLSPSIITEVDNAISVHIVSILQGTINGVDDPTVNQIREVTPNGTVIDNNGDPVNLPDGGGNYVPDSSDMTSTIGNLVSDIDNFFNGTWRYIRQLVESIGTFPQFIVQLYSWLPMEFKGVLFSAFSVVVVVAVLKVML